MNLNTFMAPGVAAAGSILKAAVASGDKDAIRAAGDNLVDAVFAGRPGPLRVTITHEPFMPWFKLEYNGQTEELDHAECLEWFRLRGAGDMDKVNAAINQAFNFGRGTKGAVYSADGSVAVYEDRPGVIVEIKNSKTPPLAPGQEARYLPKI